LVIRPCAGAESRLEYRLESIAGAKGLEGVELQVALTTGRPGDSATASCERAAEALQERGIAARAHAFDLESGPQPPINQKVGQLAAASALYEVDVIVNIDSDVDLHDFDFAPVLGPLLESGGERRLGARWVAPIERGASTSADADSAALLDASLHAFSLLGELDPGTFVGKLFALRSDALREAGGFEALQDWLGEDMELARRLREAGWEVDQAPGIAHAEVSGRNAHQVRGRYARWLAVIRWQRPHLLGSYPLLFFAAPLLTLAWSLLALALPTAAVGVLWTVLARWGLAAGARVASGISPRGSFVAGWRADYLLFRAWLRCLESAEVEWRGRVFTKGADGRMELRAH
jgi:ceramide glucosyltransferase